MPILLVAVVYTEYSYVFFREEISPTTTLYLSCVSPVERKWRAFVSLVAVAKTAAQQWLPSWSATLRRENLQKGCLR